MRLFATCPLGLEPLLAAELRELGADAVRDTRAGVAFDGPLEAAYRACLFSRVASRVLLPLAEFRAPSPEALYAGVRALPWEEHLAPEGTLAVDLIASASALTHSRYGAQKVKDAIVDRFRARCGVRPSVDTAAPDLRVNVRLHRDEATVSVDLSGEALHRRGYRARGGEAPLKENLAAAILLHARWPAVARAGGPLVDLMCGSGTLLIEGALMAADVAPGLLRERFGFTRWMGHDPALWGRLRTEAGARREAGLRRLLPAPLVRGFDRDAKAVTTARDNVRRAGLGEYVSVVRRDLTRCEPESGTGLVVANPPYGERMGADSDLAGLYAELGTQLKRCFPGWRAAVFTGNPDLAVHLKLRADRKHALHNGALPCRLLHFDIAPAGERPRKVRPPAP
jgi:23S rRNA (guanine2445-N2)-methyltransferase / 23S rRNA (guanine2069-N7)-methyltransferase